MNESFVSPIWGIVPLNLLHEKSLTLHMLRVYIALMSFQGNNEHCWPKREAIAERANLDVGYVSKAITKLVEIGWLQKTSRQNESKSNVYQVLIKAQESDPSVKKYHDPSVKKYHIPPIYKTTSENNNIPATDSEAGKPASVEDTPLNELSEEDRDLYHALKESFLSQVTGGKFTNWPKESKGLKRLLRYSTTFAIDNRSDWLQALLEAFLKLVEGHDRFWSNQPFLPSVLASDGIFPRVHKEMEGYSRSAAIAAMAEEEGWF